MIINESYREAKLLELSLDDKQNTKLNSSHMVFVLLHTLLQRQYSTFTFDKKFPDGEKSV